MVVKLTPASPLLREIGWGKSVSQANYSPVAEFDLVGVGWKLN